jgi:hypothetical protein
MLLETMEEDMVWKRSKMDGCQLYTCEEHDMEIWEMYEPVPDGRYQLNVNGYSKGVGSLASLKEYAEYLVKMS